MELPNMVRTMSIVDEMRLKYASNPEMLTKLDSILANLPARLQIAEEEIMQRAQRRTDIARQKEAFISYFLDSNPMFYVAASSMFVHYCDGHFVQVSEDDVTHMVFKHISVNRTLSRWKYKIKLTLLKRIRETPLSEASPTTSTIKPVIKSFQSMFGNKAYAKYFMVVLGDILWGRRNQVYYIDESFKPFLHLVARDVSTILSRNILDDFKHKYSSHPFSKCRMLPGKAPDKLPDLNPFDVIAVAAQFSRKYENADAYLAGCPDTELREKVLFMVDKTPTSLVEVFLANSTQPGEGMGFKDMNFLWRTFLKERNFPTMVSKLDLKHLLAEMGHYVDATEECPGRRPLVPPNKLNFAHFWKKYVVADAACMFEHGELLQLYNSWCESKNLRASLQEVKEWVRERMPGEKIRVRCTLWNKEVDLENALEAYRLEGNVDKMPYDFYYQYTKRNRKMVVTPTYFETFYQ